MSPWIREQLTNLGRVFLRPFYGGLGCILCLHRVVPKDDLSANAENRALEITPADLRAILEWVRRRGLNVIRLDEMRQRLAEPRGAKFIVFTFDDGYRDNLTHALPIFRDFGMPFTVNVTTGFISRSTSVWWYSLDDALAGKPALRFEWENQPREYLLATPEDRMRAFRELSALIRDQGRATRDDLISRICTAGCVDPLARTRDLMLSWDDLQKMSSDWHVNIGSHTHAHYDLSKLTEEEVEEELIDACAELEARLEFPVRHFAYPFGGANSVGRREFEVASAAEFTTATTTRCGNLFHEHAWKLMALPRLGLSGNYPPVLRLQNLESGLVPAKENKWKRIVVE
jgi:peptidoglycan/xylan/chitin deacetylase (PgdA/CDA1 family)